jgi:hypothetical protein
MQHKTMIGTTIPATMPPTLPPPESLPDGVEGHDTKYQLSKESHEALIGRLELPTRHLPEEEEEDDEPHQPQNEVEMQLEQVLLRQDWPIAELIRDTTTASARYFILSICRIEGTLTFDSRADDATRQPSAREKRAECAARPWRLIRCWDGKTENEV